MLRWAINVLYFFRGDVRAGHFTSDAYKMSFMSCYRALKEVNI